MIECPPSHPSHNTSISSSTPTQYIRAILNEAIIPLSSAQGCALPRADGLCPLSEFVNHASQKASEAANFDYACFGNLTEVHVGDGVRNGTVYGSFK